MFRTSEHPPQKGMTDSKLLCSIRFDLGKLDTAMEAGGPIGRYRKESSPPSGNASDEVRVLDGQDPEGSPNHPKSVPSTGMPMGSGLGHELRADTYAKPKAEVLSDANEKV